MVHVRAAVRAAAGVKTVTARAAQEDLVLTEDPVSPNIYVGTWPTTSDGALNISVVATDQKDKTGSAAVDLLVDNTAPAIAHTINTTAFHSSSIPIAATAADVNDVASLTVEGLEGFADSDQTAAAVAADWVPPAAAAEGAHSFTLSACDLVGNCATTAHAVLVDRTPPTVALVSPSPMPTYTNAALLNARVLATDGGAGVKAVKLRVGSSLTFDAERVGASDEWDFSSVPLPEGPLTISVWAVDEALEPNTGENTAAPTALSLTTLVDTAPPSPAFEALPSYFDERALDLERDSAGKPYVPARYFFPVSESKVTLPATGAAIYKTFARRWIGAASAMELEGTNATNTPFFQYCASVSSAQAPIVAATYCVGSGDSASCGSLLPSARVLADKVCFDLPIAADTIAALDSSSTSPLTLPVAISMADAAGNSSGALNMGSFDYHLVGAPLVLVDETTSTWFGADPKADSHYRLNATASQRTYEDAFNSFNTAINQGHHPRMGRFVLYNATTEPIAVSVRTTDAATNKTALKETRGLYYQAIEQNEFTNYQTPAGNSCKQRLDYGTSGGWCAADGAFPCTDYQFEGDYLLVDPASAPGCALGCVPDPPASGSTTSADYGPWNIVPQVFSNPSPSGGETELLSGSISVPAATATAPGALVLYATREFSSRSISRIQWVTDFYARAFGFSCCLGGCIQMQPTRVMNELSGVDCDGSYALEVRSAAAAGVGFTRDTAFTRSVATQCH